MVKLISCWARKLHPAGNQGQTGEDRKREGGERNEGPGKGGPGTSDLLQVLHNKQVLMKSLVRKALVKKEDPAEGGPDKAGPGKEGLGREAFS